MPVVSNGSPLMSPLAGNKLVEMGSNSSSKNQTSTTTTGSQHLSFPSSRNNDPIVGTTITSFEKPMMGDSLEGSEYLHSYFRSDSHVSEDSSGEFSYGDDSEIISDEYNTHINESVGLSQLKNRSILTMKSLQIRHNGLTKAADEMLEEACRIRVPRGLEACTLARSCAFLDTVVSRKDKTDMLVCCVDGYGNFEKFFPGFKPEILFSTTIPGKLGSMMNSHVDPRDLRRFQEAMFGASTSKVGSLLSVTHGSPDGGMVKVDISVVSRWMRDGQECTLLKQCFSDVTDAVRLTEQRETQDRMRHDVRNKIDLARCYLEEHENGDPDESNVIAAQRILASISSTIRFTENKGKVTSSQPFDVLLRIEDASNLLLEGFTYNMLTTPSREDWPMVTLAITNLAFECGVLNEIFINIRKHGDINKPILMHASLTLGNKREVVLRVENSVRRTKTVNTAFSSTNKGSNFLNQIVSSAGGSVVTELKGKKFSITLTIPVKRKSVTPTESLPIPMEDSTMSAVGEQGDVPLEKGYRFLMIEDNTMIAKMWRRALEKRGLPPTSFYHTGSDPSSLTNITSSKSELAVTLGEAVKEKCLVALIVDNYLGTGDDGEEVTGVSILRELRGKAWFKKIEDSGLMVTYFHTGTSVEDMHESLQKQKVGRVYVFEKGGNLSLGEKISSMVQHMAARRRKSAMG